MIHQNSQLFTSYISTKPQQTFAFEATLQANEKQKKRSMLRAHTLLHDLSQKRVVVRYATVALEKPFQNPVSVGRNRKELSELRIIALQARLSPPTEYRMFISTTKPPTPNEKVHEYLSKKFVPSKPLSSRNVSGPPKKRPPPHLSYSNTPSLLSSEK